ncbi:MAG: hypothetical protein MUF10_16940 [Thermoanaerobaculaceae bacterium]|jgi:hypothetical protein|nr:hypothetical protein [Thermoanaerobaculaceae bacterium]
MVVAVILAVAGALVATVGGIMLLVAAFQVSVGWGLLVLLVPFGNLVFIIKFWPRTRQATFLQLAGVGLGLLALLAFVLTVGGQGGPARGTYQPPVQSGGSGPEWPPRPVEQPMPAPATPSPLPEIPIGILGPTPEPTALRMVPTSQADEHLGEFVELVMRDGSVSRVVLHEVTGEHFRVAERYGGGGITYKVPRAKVKSIRLLK